MGALRDAYPTIPALQWGEGASCLQWNQIAELWWFEYDVTQMPMSKENQVLTHGSVRDGQVERRRDAGLAWNEHKSGRIGHNI